MYSENEDFEDDYSEKKNNGFADQLKDFYENNKKIVLILLGIVLLLIVLLMVKSCSNNSVNSNLPGEKVELMLNKEKHYLAVGNSFKLVAEFNSGKNERNLEFKWQSSNPEVATVDSLGNVNGLKLGSSLITVVVTYNGEDYTDYCEVVVIEGDENVELIDVSFPNSDNGELLITFGDKYQLLKDVNPSNGFIEKIVYTSSNTSVVEVSDTGVVKALKEGTAIVKMSVNDNKFTDELKVNVVAENVEPQMIIIPDSIAFDESKISLEIGQTHELKYQVLPKDAYTKRLNWSSSNSTVATVDENGVISGVSAGNAVITVSYGDNKTSTIAVEVVSGRVPVSGITILSDLNLYLTAGQSSTIVPNVLPANATDKTVIYSSSDSSVASVDQNGNVVGISNGVCIITVSTNENDGVKIATVVVNVGSSSSSGGSSGSGGSSSGSSSNTCTTGKIISISSDSGGAIEAYTKTGNSKIATKDVITIDTTKIGASGSCGSVEKVTYCYHKYSGYDCALVDEVQVGTPIQMLLTNGTGIMQLIIKVELSNGEKYQKDYYMNYNVSGSSNSSSSSNSSGSSGSTVEVTSMTVDNTLKVYTNSSGEIVPDILPKKASQKVTCSVVRNEGYVTVKSNYDGTRCIVTAGSSVPSSSEYNPIIRVTTADGKISRSVMVYIEKSGSSSGTGNSSGSSGSTIKVTSMKVSESPLNIEQGSYKDVIPDITPANATDKTIVCSVIEGNEYVKVSSVSSGGGCRVTGKYITPNQPAIVRIYSKGGDVTPIDLPVYVKKVSNKLTVNWEYYNTVDLGYLGFGHNYSANGIVRINSSVKKIKEIVVQISDKNGVFKSPVRWGNLTVWPQDPRCKIGDSIGYRFSDDSTFMENGKVVNTQNLSIHMCAWGGQKFRIFFTFEDGTKDSATVDITSSR